MPRCLYLSFISHLLAPPDVFPSRFYLAGVVAIMTSFLCHEDPAFLAGYCDTSALDDGNEIAAAGDDDDGRFVEMLILENSLSGDGDDCRSKTAFVKCARAGALQWMLSKRLFFRFGVRTAYLSVLYFDRYISTLSIDDVEKCDVSLLSVACLSLAAKMEEKDVPRLSAYQAGECDFVDTSAIKRKELEVLDALEWRLAAITPFNFLCYFVSKFFGESNAGQLVPRAEELIILAIEEISLAGQLGAALIAAAAVLAAFDSRMTAKTVEFKSVLIASWGQVESEHIFSCYTLMNGIERVKFKTHPSQ